jgi:hypothetical protein
MMADPQRHNDLLSLMSIPASVYSTELAIRIISVVWSPTRINATKIKQHAKPQRDNARRTKTSATLTKTNAIRIRTSAMRIREIATRQKANVTKTRKPSATKTRNAKPISKSAEVNTKTPLGITKLIDVQVRRKPEVHSNAAMESAKRSVVLCFSIGVIRLPGQNSGIWSRILFLPRMRGNVRLCVQSRVVGL